LNSSYLCWKMEEIPISWATSYSQGSQTWTGPYNPAMLIVNPYHCGYFNPNKFSIWKKKARNSMNRNGTLRFLEPCSVLVVHMVPFFYYNLAGKKISASKEFEYLKKNCKRKKIESHVTTSHFPVEYFADHSHLPFSSSLSWQHFAQQLETHLLKLSLLFCFSFMNTRLYWRKEKLRKRVSLLYNHITALGGQWPRSKLPK